MVLHVTALYLWIKAVTFQCYVKFSMFNWAAQEKFGLFLENFVLIWAEHGKSFKTSDPDHQLETATATDEISYRFQYIIMLPEYYMCHSSSIHYYHVITILLANYMNNIAIFLFQFVKVCVKLYKTFRRPMETECFQCLYHVHTAESLNWRMWTLLTKYDNYPVQSASNLLYYILTDCRSFFFFLIFL